MIRFKLFGAAAILAALIASPASAQRMIEEPGMFAFVYPNGDLGIASTRPPVDARAMASMRMVHQPIVARHVRTSRK